MRRIQILRNDRTIIVPRWCCACDYSLLPRSLECRRGLAMRILSVRPSVRLSVYLSNAWITTKRKKDLSRFLYHMKDHLASFSENKNGLWGATPST